MDSLPETSYCVGTVGPGAVATIITAHYLANVSCPKERTTAIIQLLLDDGWTEIEIREAADHMKRSRQCLKEISIAGTITPLPFLTAREERRPILGGCSSRTCNRVAYHEAGEDAYCDIHIEDVRRKERARRLAR